MSDSKNFKQELDCFYEYLFGVTKLHQEEVPKLKDELALIQEDNIEGLNKNLNLQQSFLYQIKNFDKEVAGYMKQLNLTGRNLSEVILQFPQEEQMRFYKLLSQFEETIKEVQFYKEKCQILLQTKLHVVNKKISSYELKKDKTTYQKDGKEAETSAFRKTFEKSI
ncbi:MAG: flagellar export chaperone FlgN [Acetobacterium sp.]